MATSEGDVTARPAAAAVSTRRTINMLDRVLGLLSSVRFGVTMLVILLVCCMIGMLIVQVNVDGFQEYFRSLTPAQRGIYGRLLFFDIYNAWYFGLLLAITGLNIILASIDRFPTAWQYVVKPKLTASPKFIDAQMFSAHEEMSGNTDNVADRIREVWRKQGLKVRVTRENDRITVFGQRHVWNRLGAYVVHVALLTIFTGGFLTTKYAEGGMMQVAPGRSANTFIDAEFSIDEGQRQRTSSLPFTVYCNDLQQKLIRPEGGLDAGNTIDWLTTITIKDGGVEIPAVVHLNNPVDYRGYRFFQSEFTAFGNAREISISVEPLAGGQSTLVKIPRDGSADVPGVGKIEYADFYPDFDWDGQGVTSKSGDYNNPVAQLTVHTADGTKQTKFAFTPPQLDQMLSRMKDEKNREVFLVNGNKLLLKSFEKVALAHTMTVRKDPGKTPVYLGFVLLPLSLMGVFFFSHQRMWAVIEPDGKKSKVHFGGNTNRNRPAFEGRFNSLVQSVTGGSRNE